MTIVLDASMTLAWYFEGEQTPITQATLDRVVDDGAHVPAIWIYEVVNSLRSGLRRSRIAAPFAHDAIQHLQSLQVTIDLTSLDRICSTTFDLAGRYDLTVYDASYLELALRLGLPLASLDVPLVAAARRSGVATLGA